MKHIYVSAAIFIIDGKVLSAQRGYGEWKGWWEFPGGKIEPGESPEEALKREIREEMGADIAVRKHLITIDYDYPQFHITMYCFLCDAVQGQLTLLEHEDVKWLNRNEIDSVKWLPADKDAITLLKSML